MKHLSIELRFKSYTIEMEERTKIARDLDDKEYKSWKSCVVGKKCLNYICITIGGMLLASFL